MLFCSLVVVPLLCCCLVCCYTSPPLLLPRHVIELSKQNTDLEEEALALEQKLVNAPLTALLTAITAAAARSSSCPSRTLIWRRRPLHSSRNWARLRQQLRRARSAWLSCLRSWPVAPMAARRCGRRSSRRRWVGVRVFADVDGLCDVTCFVNSH
jgi:hypothetical protein